MIFDIIDSLRREVSKLLDIDFKAESQTKRRKSANNLIKMSSIVSGVLALQPIPLDFIVLSSIQAMMVIGIGHIYGHKLTNRKAHTVISEIGMVVGVGLFARVAFVSVGKIILPGIAGLLSAPYIFALTWALGKSAMYYFEADTHPDPDKMKDIFEQEKENARKSYNETKVKDEAEEMKSEQDANLTERLEQLKDWHEKGLITKEEYEEKRKDILGEL